MNSSRIASPPSSPVRDRGAPGRTARLRASVEAGASNRPGVYTMHGPDGELLYVGKSVRVRSRLLSYFRAEPGEKAAELLDATHRIDWEPVPNEFAALVREMKLIQRWLPRFNVQHRRRRRYAFVKLTRGAAPRVVATRRVSTDGALYFGPFPAPGRVGRTVRDLAWLIGLRDCPGDTPVFFDDQLELLPAVRDAGCIRAEIDTCPAPCAGGCSSREYAERVEQARSFLEGRSQAPLRTLHDRMRAAAERHEFEYAAVLRDRMERLARFQDGLLAFRGEVEALTFLYRPEGWEGEERIYLIRRGRIVVDLPDPRGPDEYHGAAAALRSALREPDPAPGGLTADDAAEILLVARWFQQNPDEHTRTLDPGEWLEGNAPLP